MRPARLGGFTMLEIVIGMSLGVIVIGTVVGALAMVVRENRRQRAHSELQRDASHVTQLLTQELRLAGVGVPIGSHVNPGYGTGGAAFNARRVLVAAADQLMIVGDLPRPDANYPAFGVLHDRANNSLSAISWHTENNGSCIPRGADCVISTSSIFFPGGGGCTGAASRTCPWYGRLHVNDRIQIVDGAGRWSHSAMASLAPVTTTTSGGGQMGADLSVPIDPTTWTNGADGSQPTGTYGQGWVTSIDRVAYRFDSGTNTIRRRQCWGDPDPLAANWSSTTVPFPVAVDPTGAAANVCIPEEIVARHVQSVAFRYLDAPGADLVSTATDADRNLIRRIEWTIVFNVVDNTLGRPVTYTAIGSVGLQNIQPGEP